MAAKLQSARLAAESKEVERCQGRGMCGDEFECVILGVLAPETGSLPTVLFCCPKERQATPLQRF